MPRILITAFEPYDIWPENSSWLALVEFTKELPDTAKVVTRRYPVNLQSMREGLTRDLNENFDFALHIGQAPGSSSVRLESVGLNIGGSSHDSPDEYRPLVIDGPVAYRSQLPLSVWARKLKAAGIPAGVSYHAGTYLCNATLYLSHYLAEQNRLRTQATFIHLPLATSQAIREKKEVPCMPTSTAAAAIRLIVEDLAMREPPVVPSLA